MLNINIVLSCKIKMGLTAMVILDIFVIVIIALVAIVMRMAESHW